MWQIPHDLAESSFRVVRMVASVAAFSALAGTALAQDKTAADAELMLSAFDAAETASVVSANDSVANGSEVVDSVPAAPFVPVAEPAVVSVDSSSSQPEVLSDASSAGEKPALKTVLYLSVGNVLLGSILVFSMQLKNTVFPWILLLEHLGGHGLVPCGLRAFLWMKSRES